MINKEGQRAKTSEDKFKTGNCKQDNTDQSFEFKKYIILKI